MRYAVGEIVKIPSPIDVHVHLREPGAGDKETIAGGTQAALMGGYQAVFDMPNNPGTPTETEDRLDEKIEIARKTAYTDIGFYAGVNPEDPAIEEFPALVQKSAGLKFYMGQTTGNNKVRGLDEIRPAADAWMRYARAAGVTPPILLHAREDVGYETVEYIASHHYPVHWCHISTESEARRAAQLTARFPEVYTGGVTPHHLTMTSRNADFQQGWHGARMQPPLGAEVDAEALLDAYNRRTIQILETDHAPHTEDDKLKAERENPEGHTDDDCTTCYGITGIEFVLPVMFALMQRGLIQPETLVDSLYTQPIKMLGLRQAGPEPTNITTIKIEPKVIKAEDAGGKARNTPYVGWTGWATVLGMTRNGKAISTVSRSEPWQHGDARILKNGSLIGEER